MKRILSATSAAALALALLAGAPALAQEQTEDAVMNQLAQLGVNTDGLVLTEEQVLQIEAILNEGTEEEDEQLRRINELLGMD